MSELIHKVVANHHAESEGFSGLLGLAAGLSFLFGRDAVARLAVDSAQLSAGDRLVDVGCGPGSAVRVATRRGATAIGVDPAPVMLRLARLVTRGNRAAWADGSAEALPVEDGWATVVWSLSTVHHWHDVERGLAETRRVLAPGGRFIAIERNVASGAHGHGAHGWTPEQANAFADACRVSGLSGVSVTACETGGKPVLVVRAAAP